MTFQDYTASIGVKHAAVFGGILLNDGQIGNDHDDTPQLMGFGVRESKGHPRKSLSATSGNG